MIITIGQNDIDISESGISAPKYVSSLINMASSTSQATRPSAMGFSLNEYMREYEMLDIPKNKDTWKEFFYKKTPDGNERIQKSVDKIYAMIVNMRDAIKTIDDTTIRNWVEDLLFDKTFAGFRIQSVIIEKVAKELGYEYSFGNAQDESKGIDGYIGDIPVSVKPQTYKARGNNQEVINVQMLYYSKKKYGYKVEHSIAPKSILINDTIVNINLFPGNITSIEQWLNVRKQGYNGVSGSVEFNNDKDIGKLFGKAPYVVIGTYGISKNNLVKLDGYVPTMVYSNLDISQNPQIKSYDSITQNIGGNLVVTGNTLLLKYNALIPEDTYIGGQIMY